MSDLIVWTCLFFWSMVGLRMTDLENFRGDSRKSVLKFEGKRRWRVLSNVVRIRQDQETLQTIDLSFL